MVVRQPLSSKPGLLTKELRHLLRSGFPITDAAAGDVLTEQRVVIANAQHPDERASRITALERVLRQILTDFGRSPRGRAARILFGADRGLRGTNLSFRRGEAADVLERSFDHVRKHIEPQIVDEVAFALHQENFRYKPASDRGRPEIAVNEDTPILTDDSFTAQEELLCRLWSAVYGFRSELIATQRRIHDEGEAPDPDLPYHLDSAKWQLARLLSAVADYLDEYGEEILHGDVPFNVEGLVALAGWHGGIRGDEANRLRYTLARTGPDDRQAFLSALARGTATNAAVKMSSAD
jgi:hypothetical protein